MEEMVEVSNMACVLYPSAPPPRSPSLAPTSRSHQPAPSLDAFPAALAPWAGSVPCVGWDSDSLQSIEKECGRSWQTAVTASI